MTIHDAEIVTEEEQDPMEFVPHLDDVHVAVVDDSDEATVVAKRPAVSSSAAPAATADRRTYLLLPVVFLTVALLGGLRIAASDGAFVFLRPALFCLVAAAFLVVLFFRANLLSVAGWFSDNATATENVANSLVLASLFAASTQIFNALLPESGLPFWVFAFCFFWTLWTNLFSDFDVRRLLRSLAAMFALAFVVKYMILASLTAPDSDGWLQGLWRNPGKEAVTWLLELPKYSGATGYIQFFAVVLYLLGLYLLPQQAAAVQTRAASRP